MEDLFIEIITIASNYLTLANAPHNIILIYFESNIATLCHLLCLK